MSTTEGAVPLEELQRLCGQYEQALRASFPEGETFPEDWERALAEAPPESAMGALRRFGALKAFTYARHREASRSSSGRGEQAQEAARQLLRREPVEVRLRNGRVVEVTGRSYSAMYEIAAHAERVKELDQDASGVSREGNAALARRLYHELLRHRRAIWAHALTADGAPAKSLEDAPHWWSEITPEDDAALLIGLFEAGMGRYARLGSAPTPAKKADAKGENFGWASLFSSIERELKVKPATAFDTDLFQQLAWRRAGAPPLPESLGE